MEDIFYTDVAAIEKLMIDRGIKTRSQLAVVCNIDRNEITKVLNEKKQPSTATMYKLVAGLKIPPKEAGKIFFTRKLT